MRKLTFLTCLVLFLLCAPAQAETVDEMLNNKKSEPKTEQVEGSSTIVTIIKVVVTLAVLIGGFLLVVRWLNERTRGVRETGKMAHLGGVPLGKDRSVQLVRVQGKIYVVGVGQNVELIDTIEDDLEWASMAEDTPTVETKRNSPFVETFKAQLDQFQKRGRE